MKRVVYSLTGIVVLLLLGAWIGAVAVESGTDRFHGPEAAVARRALDTAEWFVPESMGILSPLVLSLRVESVEKDAAACSDRPADAGLEPLADYRATVRAYTLFGLPLRRYTATCGGASIRTS